jgi:hypothetical protein
MLVWGYIYISFACLANALWYDYFIYRIDMCLDFSV